MTEQSLDQLRLELSALRGVAAVNSRSGDEEEEGSFIASVKRKVAQQQQQPSSGQLDNTSIAEAWSRDVQLSQEVKEVAVEEAETIVLATGNRVSYLGSPIVPSMDNFISGSTDGEEEEGSSSYLPTLLACAQEVTGIRVDEEDSDDESGQEEENILEISADEEDEPEKEEDEDDNFDNQSLAALSFRLSSSQRLSNEADNDVCSSDIVVPF